MTPPMIPQSFIIVKSNTSAHVETAKKPKCPDRSFTSREICVTAAKTQIIPFRHSQSPKLVPIEYCKIIKRWNGSNVADYLGLSLNGNLVLPYQPEVDHASEEETFWLQINHPFSNRIWPTSLGELRRNPPSETSYSSKYVSTNDSQYS